MVQVVESFKGVGKPGGPLPYSDFYDLSLDDWANMNLLQIPLSSILNITYGSEPNRAGNRVEETMTLSLRSGSKYTFETDEWISKDLVAKDYWTKEQVAELLFARARALRVQAGNHGAKTRYSEANRFQTRAKELETIAAGIVKSGRFNINDVF